MTDWVVTIPKTVKWRDYEREIAAVVDRSLVMNYKMSFKPKLMFPGDRCFITWNGMVRGWMEIVGVEHRNGFTCLTTGVAWPPGWYMLRSGPFHLIEGKPMKGFQGIRKYKEG